MNKEISEIEIKKKTLLSIKFQSNYQNELNIFVEQSDMFLV